jgi:GTPase SAR1 family protein
MQAVTKAFGGQSDVTDTLGGKLDILGQKFSDFGKDVVQAALNTGEATSNIFSYFYESFVESMDSLPKAALRQSSILRKIFGVTLEEVSKDTKKFAPVFQLDFDDSKQKAALERILNKQKEDLKETWTLENKLTGEIKERIKLLEQENDKLVFNSAKKKANDKEIERLTELISAKKAEQIKKEQEQYEHQFQSMQEAYSFFVSTGKSRMDKRKEEIDKWMNGLEKQKEGERELKTNTNWTC